VFRHLFSEPELLDEPAIALQIGPLQVLKESAAAPHHPEEPLPAVVIRFVALEVTSEVIDPLRQEGDLNRRTSPVPIVQPMLLDDVLPFLLGQAGHDPVPCTPHECVSSSPMLNILAL
jgi:hypothetical protein